MGPIALFDKSFLQMLSTDESVWFDHFFYPVIAPIFYVETVADLEKAPPPGRTAEQVVGAIAVKTPQMSGAPCYFHHHLLVQNLLGHSVPMNGQIPMAGGRAVVNNGKMGTVIDEPEEAKAFARWQRGNFYDVERRYAREWRANLNRIDLSAIKKAMVNAGLNPKTCKSLQTAREMAGVAVAGLTKSTGRLDAMLDVLEIPVGKRQQIKERWKRLKHPGLSVFAPYVAHVLTVEIFFWVAIGANLISSDRPSHRVDMAYLFYLPFCNVFVSNDRLHRTCAPFFLRADQQFVWGADMKADLQAINAHYTTLPDDVKSQGVYKFARRLPDEVNGVIRPLFQAYAPNLLENAPEEKLDPEANKKLVEEIKAWESAVEVPDSKLRGDEDMTSMVIKRLVSRTRGTWVQVGDAVDQSNDAPSGLTG